MLDKLGTQDTDAVVVAPEARVAAVPDRGTSVLSRMAPAPAAIHAGRPRGCALEGKPSLRYIIAEIQGTRKQQMGGNRFLWVNTCDGSIVVL